MCGLQIFNKRPKQAYVVYSDYKKCLYNGQITYRIIDCLIENSVQEFSYFTVGQVLDNELIKSINLKKRISLISILKMMLVWKLSDISCLFFILKLYDNTIMPNIGSNRILWAIRTFIIAKCFKHQYAWMAKEFDEVFLVCYYSACMLGLTWAFRELNKDVWDVQHGYIGSEHPAYSNQALMNGVALCKPNCFVVWNDISEKFIRKVIINSVRVINTNNLHLCGERRELTKKNMILYTLDWSAQIPPAVIQAAISLNEYEWIFRKHPYDSDTYTTKHNFDELISYNHIKISGADVPLSTHLQLACLHITFNSTVAFEAEVFGVKTLYLDINSHKRFQDISNVAKFVEVNQLSTEIKRILNEAI